MIKSGIIRGNDHKLNIILGRIILLGFNRLCLKKINYITAKHFTHPFISLNLMRIWLCLPYVHLIADDVEINIDNCLKCWFLLLNFGIKSVLSFHQKLNMISFWKNTSSRHQYQSLWKYHLYWYIFLHKPPSSL